MPCPQAFCCTSPHFAARTLFPHLLPEYSVYHRGSEITAPLCEVHFTITYSWDFGQLWVATLTASHCRKKKKLFWAPKTMQDISITFACQLEFYWKQCVLWWRHWEIKLDLSWRYLLRDTWWQYSLESQILLTPYRNLTTDQSTDFIKAWYGILGLLVGTETS